MSAAVVSTSVIGSAATMIHFGVGSSSAISCTCSRNVRVFAKISGASNRKMTAPSNCSASGYERHIVEARDAFDLTQDRLVRPPGAAEHVQDRQRDGDPDARQHSEERHREEGRDRQT